MSNIFAIVNGILSWGHLVFLRELLLCTDQRPVSSNNSLKKTRRPEKFWRTCTFSGCWKEDNENTTPPAALPPPSCHPPCPRTPHYGMSEAVEFPFRGVTKPPATQGTVRKKSKDTGARAPRPLSMRKFCHKLWFPSRRSRPPSTPLRNFFLVP